MGRVLDEGLGDGQQGIGVQVGVRVNPADQRVLRGVDARIDRIPRAAGALLADHQQVAAIARRVHGEHPAGRAEPIPHHLVDLDEPELRLQAAEGAVGGAVIDDDHLELGIPQAQQPARAPDDQFRHVAHRHDQADGGRQRAGEYLGQPRVPAAAPVADGMARGQREKHQVGGVEHDEVTDAEPGEATDRGRRQCHYRPPRRADQAA